MLRNFGGLSDAKLYSKCYNGTKHLVQEYTNTVCDLLNYLCETNFENFSFKEKAEFFFAARQSYGRTALCLSGGATLGLYHIGVIKVLWAHELLPKVIAGSSLGSVFAAFVVLNSDVIY